MSYEHCHKHNRDATNGCNRCNLENAHFHTCEDERFCGGFGSTFCDDESCTQDHGNTLVGAIEVDLFEPIPCAKCIIGRRIENGTRNDGRR